MLKLKNCHIKIFKFDQEVLYTRKKINMELQKDAHNKYRHFVYRIKVRHGITKYTSKLQECFAGDPQGLKDQRNYRIKIDTPKPRLTITAEERAASAKYQRFLHKTKTSIKTQEEFIQEPQKIIDGTKTKLLSKHRNKNPQTKIKQIIIILSRIDQILPYSKEVAAVEQLTLEMKKSYEKTIN